MLAKYRFKNLIKKYSTNFDVTIKEKGQYDKATGLYVDGLTVTHSCRGCVVPYPRNVVFRSGGSILESDREIYCLTELPPKTIITYNKEKYEILQDTPYNEYGDFFVYQARRSDKIMKGVDNYVQP